jgi:hypothetical protein
VFPANLSSGQYRPHVIIDPNQLRAVTVDSVPEETYFGVTFVDGPAQILPGQSFLADLGVDVLAQFDPLHSRDGKWYHRTHLDVARTLEYLRRVLL